MMLSQVRALAIAARDWCEAPMATCLARWRAYFPFPAIGAEDGSTLPAKDERIQSRRAWPHGHKYDDGTRDAEGNIVWKHDAAVPRSLGDLEVVARKALYRSDVPLPCQVEVRVYAAAGLPGQTQERHAFAVFARAVTDDQGRVEVWAVGGGSPEVAGLPMDRDGSGWRTMSGEG